MYVLLPHVASAVTGMGNQDVCPKRYIAWTAGRLVTGLYITRDAVRFHFVVNFHLHQT